MVIHFGQPNYEDYLIYEDEDKGFRYRQRASKIRVKNGNLTFGLIIYCSDMII